MASGGYKYGSVNTDEEGGAKEFDESNLYYMKEDDLTTKDKALKAFKLAVPIIIAGLLVGVLAFMLFHNFAFLYPGRGGQEVPSKHSTTKSYSPTTTTQRSFGSSCASNPKCRDLGLFGECCPSGDGVKLSCCS